VGFRRRQGYGGQESPPYKTNAAKMVAPCQNGRCDITIATTKAHAKKNSPHIPKWSNAAKINFSAKKIFAI